MGAERAGDGRRAVRLGLGWNLSFVAATAQLADCTLPWERGRLLGFNDLLSGLTGAGLALLGGFALSAIGVAALALGGGRARAGARLPGSRGAAPSAGGSRRSSTDAPDGHSTHRTPPVRPRALPSGFAAWTAPSLSAPGPEAGVLRRLLGRRPAPPPPPAPRRPGPLRRRPRPVGRRRRP